MNNDIFCGNYAIDENIDISCMRTRQYFDYLLKYCTNRGKWELPENSRMPYFLPEYLLSIFGHFGIFLSKDQGQPVHHPYYPARNHPHPVRAFCPL